MSVRPGLKWNLLRFYFKNTHGFFFFFPGLRGRERTGRRFGSLTAVLSHTTQKMLAV